MIKGLYKSLLLVFALLILMPITVLATDVNTDNLNINSSDVNSIYENNLDEDNQDEEDAEEELTAEDETSDEDDELVDDNSDNDLDDDENINNDSDDNNDNNLVDNNEDNDDELELIKDSIKEVFSLNLLESQAYDYDENDYSVVNDEIIKIIENRLNELGIDYKALGYKFYSNFFNSNVFTYDGSITIIKNNSFVDSVVATVIFSNTNEHTEEEQQYVDEFIEGNDFNFQEEFYLDEYEENEFDIDSKVEEVSNNSNIISKSMIPPYASTSKDFPYACFYNDKYYGRIIANLDRTIIVKVPANINDINSNALEQVKQFFIKHYSDLGINDFITNDSIFYYSNGHIYLKSNNTSNDLDFGKYVFEQQSSPQDNDSNDTHEDNNQNNNTSVVNPPHSDSVVVPTNNEAENNYSNNYDNNNYSGYYNNNYYYTDNQDNDILQVTSTLEEIDNKVKEQEKESIKESENKTKKNNTTKNNNNIKTNNKSAENDKSKELKDDDSEKINAFKVLFITLAVILSIGVIIALVNRIIISRNSIDI